MWRGALTRGVAQSMHGAKRHPLAHEENLAPTSPEFAALDSTDMRAQRARLVHELMLYGDIRSAEVRDAMLKVPRHLFVPEALRHEAYANIPLSIGHRQTISQPTVVAMMSEALRLSGKERVLEVGTGSGYQSAVLAHLAREVVTLERVALLGEAARARLQQLGIRNVIVRIGDGFQGCKDLAPFDRIIVTAAPPELPPMLIEQLAPGGILVVPVGDAWGWDQSLLSIRKGANNELTRQNLGAVRFVPMLSGIEPGEPSWN